MRKILRSFDWEMCVCVGFLVALFFIAAYCEVRTEYKPQVKKCENFHKVGCECHLTGSCNCDGERFFCKACEKTK